MTPTRQRQCSVSSSVTRTEAIRVGLIVVAELVWVLRRNYSASREELIKVVHELLADPRFELQDEAAVAVAVHAFGSSATEFTDLLIAVVNTLHGCRQTMTFDRRAARLDGMALLH